MYVIGFMSVKRNLQMDPAMLLSFAFYVNMFIVGFVCIFLFILYLYILFTVQVLADGGNNSCYFYT